MAVNGFDIERSVAQTIKKIADQRISNLKLDKTVQAKVDKVLSNKKYSLSYNGGVMYAVADEDASYLPGASVYVLIPQGDFSKEKTIIGRTSGNLSNNYNLTSIATSVDNYAVVGSNILSVKEGGKNLFSISSLKEQTSNSDYQDFLTLYEVGQENNLIDVDVDSLNTYLPNSAAFMFSGKFQTQLPKSQIYNNIGNYGLILTIKTKNDDVTYNTYEEAWQSLESETKIAVYADVNTLDYKSLNDYKIVIDSIITKEYTDDDMAEYQEEIAVYGDNVDAKINYVIFKKINNILGQLEMFALMAKSKISEPAFDLICSYYDFVKELTTYTVDEDGNAITQEKIQEIYNNWFVETANITIYKDLVYEYDLDTNYMTGNPYSFTNYSYQYLIQPLDSEHFVGINGIYLFCKDFKTTGKEVILTKNIAVKDLEFYCLEEADEDNGDFKLSLSYPTGAILHSQLSSESLIIKAKFFEQGGKDLTGFTHFRWFKQDKKITSSTDEYYNSWAGVGWRLLNINYNQLDWTVSGADCLAYENRFLCVACYDMEVIAKKEFIIYNQANKRDYAIYSETGTNFTGTDKPKELWCTIDGVKDITDDSLSFVWSMTKNNQITVFDYTYDECIENSKTDDYAAAISWKKKASEVQDFSWEKNKLIFPNKININEIVYVTCTIYQEKNGVSYEIGDASIALRKGSIGVLRDNYIEIVNGDQVFQYNEAGVSPASERYNNPYQPQELSCNFYNAAGNLITDSTYTVRWQWPTSNTMLVMDESLAVDNFYNQKTCPIAISENYIFDATNNQIVCLVEFEGATYRETTSFYFGKIGENGTNGTDVVAKIIPTSETTNTVLQEEPLTLIHYDYANTSDKDDFYSKEFLYEEIEILSIEGDDPSIVEIDYESSDVCRWNNGEEIDTDILKVELYKRNELLPIEEYKNVKWSINGSSSKVRSRMSVKRSGLNDSLEERASISYQKPMRDETASYYHNYIVEADAALEIQDGDGQGVRQNYYYNYPIPVITDRSQQLNMFEERKSNRENFATVRLDKNLTMRQVLYNTEGRQPQYNENQGVKLIFKSENDLPLGKYEINWSVGGGVSFADEHNSALRIYDPLTKQTVKELTTFYYPENEQTKEEKDFELRRKALDEYWAGNPVVPEDKGRQGQLIEEWKNAETEEEKELKYDEYLEEYETYKKNKEVIDKEETELKIASVDFVKVIPQDVYSGEYNNNFVRALVYKELASSTKVENVDEINIDSEDEAQIEYFNSIFDDLASDGIAERTSGEIIKDSHDNIVGINTTLTRYEEVIEIRSIEQSEEENQQPITEEIVTYKITEIVTNKILVAEVIVPIYLSLNTYGLAALNAWDGNSIEINENEKYILAPQVGAGQKNIEDNTFTGLVMGVEKTYNADNQTETNIGLHGYNHGKQSIFLDAETGSATFGLPEYDAVDAGNPLTEGRIELVPGGTSRIARWRFDSRSLYRVVSKDQTNYLEQGLDQNRIYTKNNFENDSNFEELSLPYKTAPFIKRWIGAENAEEASASAEYYTDDAENYERDSLGNYRFKDSNNLIMRLLGVDPDSDSESSSIYSVWPTEKATEREPEAPKYAHGSIPHDQQGILLSAAPAYLSVKGKPLSEEKDGIKPDDANTMLQEGDSLEVQINPNSRSVFTIYAHINPKSHFVTDGDGKYVDKDGRILEYYWIKEWDTAKDDTRKNIYHWIESESYLEPAINTEWDETTNSWIYRSDIEEIEKKRITADKVGDRVQESDTWYRIPRVGIDESGRFYTNAIKDESVSMVVGDIGAFGSTALSAKYTGAQFEAGDKALVKFFTPKETREELDSPLFISSIDENTEGTRPIGIYGRRYFNLYSGNNENNPDPKSNISFLKLNDATLNDEGTGWNSDGYVTLGRYGKKSEDGSWISLLDSSKYESIGEFYLTNVTTTKVNDVDVEKFSGIITSSGWKEKIGLSYNLETGSGSSTTTIKHLGTGAYQKVISGAVTATYSSALTSNNENAITINHKGTLNYYNWDDLKEKQINNIIVQRTSSENAIQLLHKDGGKIRIIQNSKANDTTNEPNYRFGQTTWNAENKVFNTNGTLTGSKIHIGTIGQEQGITLYTKGVVSPLTNNNQTAPYSYFLLQPGHIQFAVAGAVDKNSGTSHGVTISNDATDDLLHISNGIFTRKVYAIASGSSPVDTANNGEVFASNRFRTGTWDSNQNFSGVIVHSNGNIRANGNIDGNTLRWLEEKTAPNTAGGSWTYSNVGVWSHLNNIYKLIKWVYNQVPSGVDWSDITNKPSTFPPSSHNHRVGIQRVTVPGDDELSVVQYIGQSYGGYNYTDNN